MSTSGNYRVKLRRRREGKTDYQARKALVTSRKPRLVTRASLKNATVQISLAKPSGDQVLASANSRELIKNYGWKAPTGNIPAAYLTGLLCGYKAKAAGVKEAILDIGLISPTKGSKIFAMLSGVLDADIDVPHSEEKIVKERMKGEHIAKYAKNLGPDSEEYNAKFSKYKAKEVAPEKIGEHFTKVKADIVASFKGGKQVVPTHEKKASVKEEPAPAVEEKEAQKASVKKPAAKKEAAPKKKPAKEKAPAAKEKAPKEKTSKKGVKKA